MKRTLIKGIAGQKMLLTLELISGEWKVVACVNGECIKIVDLHDGQQTFLMTEGDVYVEQSDNQGGLFNVIPWRSGGVVQGASAYEIAVENGFVGSVQDWLASLKGVKGNQGEPGIPGKTGKSGFNVGDIKLSKNGELEPGCKWCNGEELSPTDYADLFAEIDYAWGRSGDNFLLPDFRGVTLRGMDDGRGLDGNRVLGSYQQDSMQQITGSISGQITRDHGSGATLATQGALNVVQSSIADAGYASTSGLRTTAISFDSSLSPGARTANENRMKNVAVRWMIKYTSASDAA